MTGQGRQAAFDGLMEAIGAQREMHGRDGE